MADLDETKLLDIASRMEMARRGLVDLDLTDDDLEEILTLIGEYLDD